MRHINKFLILLISVAFIASGTLAQSDAPPKLKDQLEQQVKPPKTVKNLQELGSAEGVPSASEQMIQTVMEDQRDPALAFWPQERDMSEKSGTVNINPSDEMFDLQFSWPVGVGGGEAGVETDDTYIYTTKWNGTDFYKYDLSGNLIETFTCGTAGAIRDLAYDGTYFYGAAASPTVFQMDFNTQTVVSTFSAPSNIRAIAYNEDDDLFYGNNWSDDIQVFDPTGTSVTSFPAVSPDRSYYGFAYDNYCDGTYLWGYSQLGSVAVDQNILIQIELPSGNETGLTFDVATLITPTTGIAGGLCISNALYTGTYTIMGNMQNEFIWGLELCPSGPPATTDVGIQSIISPESGIDLTSTEPVTVIIKNFGTDPQSNFDIWFEMDGGGQVVETITATINGGETLEHTFGTTVDLSSYGTYEFESCTDLAGDENPANDCKTKSVENSEPSQSFCMPIYSTGCDVGDGLTDFAVDAIQNYGSGCANNTGFSGWSEYYELGPAILLPGFDVTFTLGTGFVNQYVNIWIDFNDDMDLTPDEMILQDFWLDASGVLFDVDITIPAGATPGNHKMRAMAVYAATFTDPCGSYTYGEAEDYSVVVGVPDYGNLDGYVTENTGGAPIQGAMISVNNGVWTTTTGADGYYEIIDVLVGDWPIDCTKDGYNPEAATVNIAVGATTQQDFAMTSPTMDITPTSIDIVIDPNAQATEYIDIANNGDGMLGWSAQLEMLTENTDDAWDLQFSFDLEAATGAPGNAGAECDGVYYYSTRWATNLIHKFDFDGNLIEEFSIGGVSGLRDLAFDGTYMYGGAAANTIYEMDFVGQTLISSFTSSQPVRSIAYDDGNDAFWVANWDTDIDLVDKSGVTINTFPAASHGLGGIYGTAYDTWSTGSPLLWIFDQGTGAGTAQIIYEADLGSLTMTGFSYDVMADLGPNASAIAGGLFVVPNVYSGILSIGGLLQGTPDTYFIYELAPAQGLWITIDPSSGDVDPGNTGIMDVNFDATDIVPGTIKTANIHFSSDPDVGSVTVPVTMTVGNLQFGYIEGNVELTGNAPYNYEDVQNVLVEAGPYSTYPDAMGDYQITAYPGTYDVTATLYGYTQQVTNGITVVEGGTVSDIDFTLPCIIGKLFGEVTDVDTGDPIENVTVTLVDTDFEMITGADGMYEFLIEDGTYDVQASHPTYTTGFATVVISVETDTQQDFELEYSCDYCDATTTTEDEWIMDVMCGTIQNLGTGWQGGIADYTDQFTIIMPGFSEDITIENGNAWASDIVYVWVDWNMNCEFDVPDEEIQLENVGGAGQTFTGEITAPVNAEEGMVRMRVRMTYSTPPEPCDESTYGEVEEYSILVGAGTYGELEGFVTEAGSGNPIEGAEIDIAGMYQTTSGSDGYYYFDDVFTGTWDVTCTATGYNSGYASVTIEEGVLTVQDFELGVPGFSVDPLEVEVTMDPNSMQDETVNINNPGNGDVDWISSVVFLMEGTDDAWDLQFSFDLDVATGAPGNAGAECDGEYYYSTRWATNLIHKFDFDGNLIEEFSIGGVSGLRDLAFDGTYMYGGAAANTIYEMDFVNQTLVSSFSSSQPVRNIAYDDGNDAFWVANWDTDIDLVDKSGVTINTIPAATHGLGGMYGSAYDEWSQPTVHEKWNPNVAILSGDTMMAISYDFIMKAPENVKSQVFSVFNQTAIEVCEGQQYDMDFESQKDVSIADYIKMIRLKTAVLLAGSLKIGAIVAEASDKDAENIYQFGENIGIAFQLKDDLLDVFSDANKFGKQTGGDIVANKKTFLYLKAFGLADDKEFETLYYFFNNDFDNESEKIKGVKEIYEHLNIEHETSKEIEKYFNKAMEYLNKIDIPAEHKSELINFADRLKAREY